MSLEYDNRLLKGRCLELEAERDRLRAHNIELLAALEAAAGALEDDYKVAAKVSAAIAKAKGET